MTKQTNTVDNLVAKARKAQLVINEYTQDQVDELILAIAWEIIKPENNQYLFRNGSAHHRLRKGSG